jgi:hypothetical protein
MAGIGLSSPEYFGHLWTWDKHKKKEEIITDSPRRLSAMEIGQGWHAAPKGER